MSHLIGYQQQQVLSAGDSSGKSLSIFGDGINIWEKQSSSGNTGKDQSLAYYLPNFIEDEIEEGKGGEDNRVKQNNLRLGIQNSNNL